MRNLLPLLMALTGLFGCTDLSDLERARTDLAPEYAFPLFHGEVTIEEFLNSFDDTGLLEIDSLGELRIRYRGNTIERTTRDALAPALTLLQLPIPVTDTLFELPFRYDDILEVDSALFKTGKLTYFFNSKHPDSVRVTVSFPQLRKNGQPLVLEHVLPPSGGAPVPLFPNPEVDLAGYSLAPDADGRMWLRYEALRLPDMTRDTLSDFYLLLQNVEFSYIQGYLGNYLYDGARDTIEIEFLEKWRRGNVYFADPRVYLYVTNSFGLPTRSVVNVFDVYTLDGQVLQLQSPLLTNGGLDFVYPTLDEVGQVKTQTIVLHKDNSNIAEILGANPLAVDYDIDALTNPDSNTAIRGFLTDSSYYRFQVEVVLPVYGQASDFAVTDTFDFNPGNLTEMTAAEIKLVAENELPIGMAVQVYLADEQGVLDSLFDAATFLIEPADVNEFGYPIEKRETTTYVPVEGMRLQHLLAARMLILEASFNTTNGGQVPVRMNFFQGVRIRAGMKAKF